MKINRKTRIGCSRCFAGGLRRDIFYFFSFPRYPRQRDPGRVFVFRSPDDPITRWPDSYSLSPASETIFSAWGTGAEETSTSERLSFWMEPTAKASTRSVDG